MAKVIGYFLTPIYLLSFGITLLIFDVFQRIAWTLGGYSAQQNAVYWLNGTLMRLTYVLGGRISFDFSPVNLPAGKKFIFVANHQSMNDIPPMIWHFRKYAPIFIAKKELERGVPSISYNYKRGGVIAIDRKDGGQARAAIMALGERLKNENISVCIFPEGTRARDGKLKPFQSGGVKTLLAQVPDAVLVPVVVANSWKMVQYGFWPIPAGIHLRFKVLEPLDAQGLSADAALETIRNRIAEQLEVNK
jgi:1-acyl-sn-glycerol-3-phosphate acyltransferase